MTLFKKSAQQVRAQNTQTDYQGDFRKIKLHSAVFEKTIFIYTFINLVPETAHWVYPLKIVFCHDYHHHLIKVFNGSSVKSVILSQSATGISWYAWLVFFWWDLILLCFVATLIAAAFQNPKLLFF